MLLALPEQLIATDTCRLQRAETLTERAQPEETPWPAEFLEDAPPQLEREESETGPLATLIAPVDQLAQRTGPMPIDWAIAATEIRALDDELRTLEGEDSKRSDAEGWLTAASVQVVAREPLPADDATAIATEILVRPASDPRLSQPDDLEDFDHGPHWGFPAGRVDAAEVSWLSHRATNCQTMGCKRYERLQVIPMRRSDSRSADASTCSPPATENSPGSWPSS